MHGTLTEDQRMMRDVAAKFARSELMPIANEIDHSESTPDWVIRRCAELGFLGVFIPEQYGCVAVDRSAPGFQVQRYEEKLGWRGTNTGPIAFTDVAVSGDDVLGDLLTANADIAPINQASFMGHAATSLGCLQGLFDLTVAYVQERSLYGEPMYRLSPVSDRIGQIYTKIDACRALLYASASQYEAGTMTAPQGSVCKAYICDTAFECTSQLLQMWGGSGMMNGTGVNRYMRDARTKMIAEGATEMHHAIIASVLGIGRLAQT